MIYRTPRLDKTLTKRLAELDRLRSSLGDEVRRPGPWLGTLRRLARASAVESSVSIEGFSVAPDDAVAIVADHEAVDPADEDGMAVACYARALEHVGVLAVDPAF